MTKFLSCAAVLGLLVASSSSVLAKGPGGGAASAMSASTMSPGHESKSGNPAPVPGLPGASGWSPGQQMGHDVTPRPGVTAPGNGAAVYAPGFLK
jgi:hypothetical protein